MMNNRRLKDKDWKIISAYLDGQLAKKKEKVFEARLAQELELRDALRQIQWTKTVLKKAPRRKVPHHFILTRQMAAEAKRRQNRVIRQYGLVSGIASLTFLLLVGIQLVPFFKMDMAANLAMAPKEAIMEESMMMEAETIEEFAGEDSVQVQEEPVVEAEIEQDVETAEMLAEAAEEGVVEEEVAENAAVAESEEVLNETANSVEEEMQPPAGGDGETITPMPVSTENVIETPTVDATSEKLAEEHDDCMDGSAPRSEETVEFSDEEGLITEDAAIEDSSAHEDEYLLDQPGIDKDESLTEKPSDLEILAFAGMLLSGLIAVITLVAVFRMKNRA